MDCNVLKNNINLCKIALESFAEEKIDFDIIIPDYCAAAGKILKCEVVPSILSRRVENDKVILEGNCTVNVLYLDENTLMIRSISETAFFTQSHLIKKQLDNYRIKLKLRASNVICRLQNSRRVSVKALVGVAVKVSGTTDTEIINGFDDLCIETKFDNTDCCVYNACSQTDIKVNSEIQAKTPVLDILKCSASIKKCTAEVINDRAIIKGECEVECLYASGDFPDDVKTVRQSIPFSDIMEIDGANEEDICDLSCEVISLRCTVGNSDEQNIINVEVIAFADAAVYSVKNIRFLRDAYSRENELSLKYDELEIESLDKMMRFDFGFSESFEIDHENCTVDDAMLKPYVKNVSIGENGIVIEGDIYASFIMHNGSDYKAVEKTFSFKNIKEIDFVFDRLRCEINVCADNIAYSISDNQLKFECMLKFDFIGFTKNSLNVVNDVKIGSKFENSYDSKVVLYYADKGEDLWEIAKQFCTSVEVLKRDNKLDDEKITENKAILISNK